MTCLAVIQARMGSRRLPGKVLKPLADRPVLEHVLRRVGYAQSVHRIVLATTRLPEDDVLVHYAKQYGALVVRGEDQNVLARFFQVSELLPSHCIARITADCPCIDPAIIDNVVRSHYNAQADYTSNVHPRTYPRGFDVEVINTRILRLAYRSTMHPYDQEHVTPFIWRNQHMFRIHNVFAPPQHRKANWRLTLDTPQDLIALQAVFDLIGKDFFHYTDVLSLARRYPWLPQINANVSN